MGIYKNNNNNLELIAGGTLYADAPIGAIFALLTTKIPKGFILCDDTVYNKTDYPELWELLPDIVKDTTNETFTIDLRESTLKGVGLTSKSSNHYDSDGIALGEFIDDRFQDHAHKNYVNGDSRYPFTTATGTLQSPGSGWSGGSGYDLIAKGVTSSSMRTGNTTEVKSTGVNYIIKAKQSSLPLDISKNMSYSTDEIDTGKRWIDGKPIYRKVLLCTSQGSIPAVGANWGTIPGWNTTGIDIETLTYWDAPTVNEGNNLYHPEEIGFCGKFACISNALTIAVGTPLIVEYTKTTD